MPGCTILWHTIVCSINDRCAFDGWAIDECTINGCAIVGCKEAGEGELWGMVTELLMAKTEIGAVLDAVVSLSVFNCDQQVIFGDHDMRGEMMTRRQHCAFQRT